MKDANWITNGNAKPFYARKAFTVKAELTRAVIHVSGLGQFNFWLNGERVNNHRIEQSWTDYNKIVQYVTLDITQAVRTGQNVAGFEVGNGWYILDTTGYSFQFPDFVPMPPNPNPYQPFAKSLVLAFSLELCYADGSTDTITSDESTLVYPHGVTAANVYGSENIDGRLLARDFSAVAFDDSHWKAARLADSEEQPRGKLIPQTQPSVSIVRSYRPACTRLVDGIRVYDIGENVSFVLECDVFGKSGEQIAFFFAEKCDEKGLPDQVAKGWLSVTSRIVYTISKDNCWEHVEQTFSYAAGRFIGVRGNADVRALTAHAVTSATEDAGSFVCDNEKYNKILHIVKNAVESNLMSVHTDCPTIERFAWLEESQLIARSVFYLKNEKALWEKMLLDARTAQHTKADSFNDGNGGRFFPGEGLIPSQAPCYLPNVLPVPGMGSFYDTIAWGSFIILGAKWHYLHYGDKRVIADNYDAGVRYFAHLSRKLTRDGFINHGLGDWGNPTGEFSRENTETAFFYADAVALSEAAHVLGKQSDEAFYTAEAARIKQNYNEKLLRREHDGKKGAYYVIFGDSTQKRTTSAQALPLYWGLVPEDAQRKVEEAFRESFMQDGALVAGEVALPFIIQCANRLGMNETLSRYLLREEHPSYYAFVKDGETSLGEYWEHNPRSHNHDMLGSIAEWYFNGIAGIEPLAPGFARVRITPFLPSDMQEFRCSYTTPHGTITVAARRTADGSIQVQKQVPEGIELVADA